MVRKAVRLHNLMRPRVRQSWNKYNLFNLLSNAYIRRTVNRSTFAQKWYAKSLTRGYHGEHLHERHWKRMFRHNHQLNAVVDMDPRYMAEFDGSEQATGRGSGRQQHVDNRMRPDELQPWLGTNLKSMDMTPYMQMSFVSLERRLDTALFRALFASSTRQARQFITHGYVKVNGTQMVHPGYLLNPGDMFQVEVDRVLYAAGAKKPTRQAQVRAREKAQRAAKVAKDAEEAAEGGEGDAAEAADAADAAAEDGSAASAPAAEEPIHKRAVRELPYLAARAKHLLSAGDDLSVKRKKALRQFLKDARKWVAKASSISESSPPPSSAVVDHLADLLATTGLRDNEAATSESRGSDHSEGDSKGRDNKKVANVQLTPEERQRFQELLARDLENPIDPSKPYITPWRPRPYLAPFAFIPRYLEVNQNICAAVYVRHPVARPGKAEVPTPFPYEINQLAFNWYMRH